jgi:hypothetical protein
MATTLGHQPAPHSHPRSAGVSAVLDVLDTLDRHGPVTLAQLARETGVPKSTLHRVCSTMGDRGWPGWPGRTRPRYSQPAFTASRAG